MAGSTVPQECCHIPSIPTWASASSGFQMAALLQPQLHSLRMELQGSDFTCIKMWINFRALLASKVMDSRQHSATGVLMHPSIPTWDFTSSALQMAALIPTQLPGFRMELRSSVLTRVKMWIISKKALLPSKDMDSRQLGATAVLPHPFITHMSLHKLWVANGRLASTSAARFPNRATWLRFDTSQNVG